MSFYIMCFFFFNWPHKQGLKRFFSLIWYKKVAYFFCGSGIVTWSNNGDKNSGEELGPHWALSFILRTALRRKKLFQVQIPDGHLSHNGRSSVPSSLVNEFLFLCALMFNLLILFTKFWKIKEWVRPVFCVHTDWQSFTWPYHFGNLILEVFPVELRYLGGVDFKVDF